MPRGDTPEKTAAHKRIFLAAYAQSGNRTNAAKKAGVTRKTRWRWEQDDSEFAAAKAEALEQSIDLLELETRRRAMIGVDVPQYYKGQRIDTVKKYSDVLLMFKLNALRPEKYRARIDVNAKVQHTAIDMNAVKATSNEVAMTTRNELMARHKMLDGSEN